MKKKKEIRREKDVHCEAISFHSCCNKWCMLNNTQSPVMIFVPHAHLHKALSNTQTQHTGDKYRNEHFGPSHSDCFALFLSFFLLFCSVALRLCVSLLLCVRFGRAMLCNCWSVNACAWGIFIYAMQCSVVVLHHPQRPSPATGTHTRQPMNVLIFVFILQTRWFGWTGPLMSVCTHWDAVCTQKMAHDDDASLQKLMIQFVVVHSCSSLVVHIFVRSQKCRRRNDIDDSCSYTLPLCTNAFYVHFFLAMQCMGMHTAHTTVESHKTDRQRQLRIWLLK